jgi:hypothetical protein
MASSLGFTSIPIIFSFASSETHKWAREFQGQITARPFLPHVRSSLFSIRRSVSK